MDSGLHDGGIGLAERAPPATIVAEPRHAHAGIALSAYCRELCGPASDRAVAAILAALNEGPDAISEEDLLRTTRATAAEFAFAGMDGSRGKLRATLSKACAPTPSRLAASASRLLAPHEERDLAAHLQECLPCSAIQIKQNRAERGFAVLWSPPSAGWRFAAPSVPATADERAGALGKAARAKVAAAAGLDGAHARAAAKAYCRELCRPATLEQAVAASLEPLEMATLSRPIPEDELLRTTRLAAAGLLASDIGDRDAADGSRGTCANMTIALADRANGELGAEARRQLDAHLEQCMVCQATRIRMARAGRAFVAMAGASVDVGSWFDLPALPVPRHAAPQARPERAAATSPRRAAPAPAPSPAPPKTSIAAAATAPTRSATPPRRPVAVAAGDRARQVRRRRRFLAVAAMLLTVVVAVAAVVLSRAPSTSPAAGLVPSRTAHVGAASTGTHAATAAKAAKAKPAGHPAAVKTHHAANTRRAAKTHRAVTAHRATPAKHAAPATVVSTPPARVVVAPARVVSAPVTERPASTRTATRAKPSPPSATPQGPSLPAQKAPTKGIGSGG